jgi:hypothetical protein
MAECSNAYKTPSAYERRNKIVLCGEIMLHNKRDYKTPAAYERRNRVIVC